MTADEVDRAIMEYLDRLPLLELIAQEDKSSPLSDEDLVKKLQETGYPVARRTVTKYRKMLKIPSSSQRKDWAAQ